MLPNLLLPTLFPALLNATLPSTSPPFLATSPTTPPKFVYCIPPTPSLIPTTFLACKRALAKIPLGDAGLKPLSFGRSPDAGFQVPHTWEYGNCAVQIDVEVEGDGEGDGKGVRATATFAEVLMAGFDIAVECVIKEGGFGGRAVVGGDGGGGGGSGEGGLGVFVWGTEGEGGR